MNVAILGLGVVGKGVYDILSDRFKDITISYVLEIDSLKTKNINSKVVTDYNIILQDDTVDLVVELIGGVDFAYTAIKQALSAKKNVVTANKAIISKYFEEFTNLANANNVSLRYEASVGGGTIVLDPLYEISKNNLISNVKGIINGSTNYVLSKFFEEDMSLEESLKLAFDNGYLETGNNDDMAGLDLLRKINILSSISYHQFFKESSIFINPLDSITKKFLKHVKNKNLIIKFMGESRILDNQVSIRVEPVIIDKHSIYSHINYEQNYIEFFGENFEHLAFQGIGAGRYPTASAVVNDIVLINCGLFKEYDFSRTDLSINNDMISYRYLVLKNNKFTVTKELTISELDESYKDMTCYARIDGDIDV